MDFQHAHPSASTSTRNFITLQTKSKVLLSYAMPIDKKQFCTETVDKTEINVLQIHFSLRKNNLWIYNVYFKPNFYSFLKLPTHHFIVFLFQNHQNNAGNSSWFKLSTVNILKNSTIFTTLYCLIQHVFTETNQWLHF